MKNIIRIVTALVKVSSIVLGLSAYANMLPAQWAWVAVIAFAVASAVKEVGVIVCDYLDDGKRNNSFDLSKVALLAGLLMCGMLLTSCGVTREQWAEIGKGVLLREGAVVYGQVQSARAVNAAAAKNPVKVVPGS
jgi:hypothetical protein